MKALLIVSLAVFLLGVGSSDAQTRYRIGGELAIISANGTVTPEPATTIDITSRTGVGIGAFVAIEFSPLFTLQPGLRYSQRGAEADGAFYSIKLRFDYIEVPVLARVTLLQGSIRPFVQAGPVLGFLSSAEAASTVFGTASTSDQSEYTQGTTLNLDLGAGAEILLTPTLTLHAGLGYTQGLTDVNKGNPSVTESTIAKHNAVNVFVAVGVGM
jgi:opacity protein-like surface antigen